MSIDLEKLKQSASFLQQAIEPEKKQYTECAQTSAPREPRYFQHVETAKHQLHIAHHLVDVFDAFGYGIARDTAVEMALKNAQLAVESLVLLREACVRGE